MYFPSVGWGHSSNEYDVVPSPLLLRRLVGEVTLSYQGYMCEPLCAMVPVNE